MLVFGHFRLFPDERRLEKDGMPVRLGGRALDILIALAERAGETVPSRWLVEHVWPDVKVDDGSLRFHIKNLRKTLSDGADGMRYIVNVAGRGYCFVAPVERIGGSGPRHVPPPRRVRLPKQLRSILGRADNISAVSRELLEEQLVTLTGPAGIGKTTLAVAISHLLHPHFDQQIHFVDLAPIEQGDLVAPTVASALGIPVPEGDPVPAIIGFLQDKRLLVVFDNCEQVIQPVAGLVLRIVQGAPDVRVLVTSREPLQLVGERVHRLMPLDCPPPGDQVNAREAMGFPAIQLFVDRAAATVSGFTLDDERASLVADICRRLDGIPLAIELAAARLEFFGVAGLAKGLDDMFSVLTQGRRFALPRHQTLRATLDWGYHLLSDDERCVLQQLAVFRAAFSLDAALAVVACEAVSRTSAESALASLVAKSLLNATESGGVMQYRLLEITRQYASEKLAAGAELQGALRRHAQHQLQCIRLHAGSIDDIRAALDWSFAPGGDLQLGIELTALSAPLWFALSLIHEYRARAEYAHTQLAAAGLAGSETERTLNLSLSTALFYTGGPAPIDLSHGAARPDDGLSAAASRLRAIWQLAGVKLVHGDYRGVVVLSDEFDRICAESGDEAAAAAGDRMRAFALHLSGHHAEAEVRARRALLRNSALHVPKGFNESEIDNVVTSLSHLARILWIRGYAEQAVVTVEEGLTRALSMSDQPAACFILGYTACPIAVWAGDRAALARYLTIFDTQLTQKPLQFWFAWRNAFELVGAATVEGFRLLRAQPPDDVILVDTLATLHEELVGAEVISRADRGECGWCLPEVLRVRGVKLLEESPAKHSDVEALFGRAIDVAREQGALAWELRAATTLARLQQSRGDRRGADATLAPVYSQFTEGFETADLAAAARLLKAFPRARSQNITRSGRSA